MISGGRSGTLSVERVSKLGGGCGGSVTDLGLRCTRNPRRICVDVLFPVL